MAQNIHMFPTFFLPAFFEAVKLAFKVAWGTAKAVVSVLCAIAVPMLTVCLLFVGGIALLVPVALIGIAFGILKKCI